MDKNTGVYEEKIGYSRGSLWAPFHAVGMVSRIHGEIPIDLLRSVLVKLQTLYPALASCVRFEQNGCAWLTTDGVPDCTLEIRPMSAEDDWTRVFLQQEQIPFPFDTGPLARFFLLRGDAFSDLVMVAPHVICDGYAVAQLMGDAIGLLNYPEREVTFPPPPQIVSWENVPHSFTDVLPLRGLIHVANWVWPKTWGSVDQQRYEDVHHCYWERRRNGMLSFSLSSGETASLLERCRQHEISFTGALISAFLCARRGVERAEQLPLNEILVAVNIRDRVVQSAGCAMVVYASVIDFKLNPKPETAFWELAREAHDHIHNNLSDRSKILWPLAVNELNPVIADTLLAQLCSGQLERRFGLLTRIVKIGVLNPGMDVSNIGHVEIPANGGPYSLETIFPLPPLSPGGGLAVNVLTVNGRMNVILKFRLDQLDPADVSLVRERVLGYLHDEK